MNHHFDNAAQDHVHPQKRSATDIPARAGVGFKADHASAVLEGEPRVNWFEVHPENYMVAGGGRLKMLEALRALRPLSLHGVGMSLGGAELPDDDHLVALKKLVDRFEPGLVSEHIAWSGHEGLYLADLLPPPLTETSLSRLVNAVDKVQNFLGRRILIENPTSYLALPQNSIPEIEFIVAAARQSGCGLLIDVNNIYLSAHNIGIDAHAYVDALPDDLVGEIHLAGFEADQGTGDDVLIDTHSRPVSDPVWDLYLRLIHRIGARPTLIEWDNDVPAWPVLEAEAIRADHLLADCKMAALREAS